MMRRRESRPRPPQVRFPEDARLDGAFADVYARLPKEILTREEIQRMIDEAIGKHETEFH